MSFEVFSHPNRFTLIQPKYKHKKLKASLEKIFKSYDIDKNILIKNLPKKIVIPTVILENQKVKRWKLDFIENFTKKGGYIKAIDAILESTAAPTYFPSPRWHIDGGMGMKDPCIAASMYAYHPETTDLKNFVVLSFGTGYENKYIKKNEKWGKIQWLFKGTKKSGNLPLLNMIMNVEEQIPSQISQKFLGNQFLKIDFSLSKSIALDDYKSLGELIKETEQFILKHPILWKPYYQWIINHIFYGIALN